MGEGGYCSVVSCFVCLRHTVLLFFDLGLLHSAVFGQEEEKGGSSAQRIQGAENGWLTFLRGKSEIHQGGGKTLTTL